MGVLGKDQLARIKRFVELDAEERVREAHEQRKAQARLKRLEERAEDFRLKILPIVSNEANGEAGFEMVAVGEPVETAKDEIARIPVSLLIPRKEVQLLLIISNKGPEGAASFWKIRTNAAGKQFLELEHKLPWPELTLPVFQNQFRIALDNYVLKA